MSKTISARAFNQDVSAAKRATSDGPVFITDRGEPKHVLLSITEYESLRGQQQSLMEALAMDEVVEFPVVALDVTPKSPGSR